MPRIRRRKAIRRFLEKAGWITVIFLALLTAGAAVHRFVVVSESAAAKPSEVDHLAQAARQFEIWTGQPAPVDVFDIRYNQHPYLSYLHVLPGIVFMVLGPLQFSRRIRARWLNFHRWSGRIFLIASLTGAITSLVMAVRFPAFGGWSTGLATYAFGLMFIFCVVKAYYHIRRKEIVLHREWMIRGFAIGLGVSTIRVVGLLFVIFGRVRLEDVFGISFWVGFIINLIAAEIWINFTRARTHAVA